MNSENLSAIDVNMRSVIFGLSLIMVVATFSAWITTEARGEETAGVRKYSPLPVSGEIAQGGYVLVLEHLGGEEDDGGVDCNALNVLTDQQRSVAEAIGEAFQRNRIPVARVLSSSRCAARETAKYLDLGDVIVDAMLDPVSSFDTTDPQEVHRIRQMLSLEFPEGENVLLVSHGVNVARLLKSTVSNPPGTLHAFHSAEDSVVYAGALKPGEWVKGR